jgi:hypothetical protein
VSGEIHTQAIDAISNITQNPLHYAMLQNGDFPD